MTGNIKGYVKKAMAAGVAAAAIMTVAGPAEASRWWVRGNILYYSGGTRIDDGFSLQLHLERARAAGVPITTIVFRDAPGGAAIGGAEMADLIQREGLTTVFQGGCYSACAMAYSGGARRGMAAFDLPGFFGIYDRNALGYHGASIGGVLAPEATQLLFYDFIANYLLGSDITPEARERLRLAHVGLEDPGGFLRYFDPAVAPGADVIFCPSQRWTTGDLAGCTQYENTDIYRDGIANVPGYIPVNDILHLQTTFTGDLNPNWQGWGDVYGLIKITGNGVYNVSNRTSTIQTWIKDGGTLNLLAGAIYGEGADTIIDRGGTLNLRGGTLTNIMPLADLIANSDSGGRGSADVNIILVKDGGRLGGHGRFVGSGLIRGEFAPTGLVLAGYVNQNAMNLIDVYPLDLDATSVTRLQVTPQTTTAALRSERAALYVATFAGPEFVTGQLNYHRQVVRIASGAALRLDFTRGFYRPGQIIPLFDSYTNPFIPNAPSDCNICTGGGSTPGAEFIPTPFYSGRFSNYVRASDGAVIALDPLALSQIVDVGADSLLGFDLVYAGSPDVEGLFGGLLTPNFFNNFSALSLVARPAFNDTSIFANAASGDGLGQALLAASNSSSPRIEELLGALQFSSRTAARAASGTLRGDAYATQAFGDQVITGALDDVHFARLADLRADRDRVAQPFSADIVQAGATADSLAVQSGEMLRYLVDGPQEPVSEPAGDGRWLGWGQMLIGKAETEAGLGVAGLNTDYRGVVVGADRPIRSGEAVVGASLSYLSGENETAGDAYDNDVEVVSGSLYGTLEHRFGAVTGSARISRLSHETTRRVSGIGGLEFPVEGDYSTTDAALHLQSVIDVPDFRGASVRFFAPTLSYQRTEGVDVEETGGAFRLSVDGEDLETARLGVGGEVSRSVRIKDGTLTPHLRLGYERELADVTTSVTSAFVPRPDLPFIARSQELGRDIGRVDAGVTIVDDGRFAATMQYQGRFREGQEQHGGFVGLSYRF